MNGKTPCALKWVLGFSFAGFLFSGYLTFTKLLTGACAFNESCPIFFGHPACWYGFALYVALLTLALAAFTGKLTYRAGMSALASVSFVGVLFAGYLSSTELPALLARGFGAYTFGLPTCFLGLIFFVLIFIFSFLARGKNIE